MKLLTITGASLTYRHVLELAGVRCDLQTNSSQLESTLRQWLVSENSPAPSHLSMQVFVSAGKSGFTHDGHFRGLGHVVVASFGPRCVFILDMLRRSILGAVTEDVVCDPLFWNDILLPIAVGVLGATVGLVPVHCACLSSEGEGLIIAGISGAGKSTLSAALAQSSFDYISDDWTYFSQQSEILTAHGMAARLKLLPDALSHFPNLSRQSISRSSNGELAYQVTAGVFGAPTKLRCIPRWGIFLERTSQPGCELTPASAEQAREYLTSSVERLPLQLGEVVKTRANILNRIAGLPWWILRYAGAPHLAAQELRSFVSQKQMAAV